MACKSFDCKHFKFNKCRIDKKQPHKCTRYTEEGCFCINDLLKSEGVLCAGCKNTTCQTGYSYYLQLNQKKKAKVEEIEQPLFVEEPVAKAETNITSKDNKINDISKTLPATAYVDGSFNTQTNTYGYGIVMMVGLDTFEYSGSNNNKEVAKIRNVAGELLGAMTSVVKAKEKGCQSLIICYDYEGIEKWVTGEWQTKNEFTQKYKAFMNASNIKIRFKKVKAHSGECFNEQADILAKRAVGV